VGVGEERVAMVQCCLIERSVCWLVIASEQEVGGVFDRSRIDDVDD
jgi:hypothetical protein